MKVTLKMFNDNPNLSPLEILEKVSKDRHKSNKTMPTPEERKTEHEIKQLEQK